MHHMRLSVKTDNGWVTKHIKYTDFIKIKKYLSRYYKGKEYTCEPLNEADLKIIELGIGKKAFDNIDWVVIK